MSLSPKHRSGAASRGLNPAPSLLLIPMKKNVLSRRHFLGTTATAGVALSAVSTASLLAADAGKPAKLGGAPVRTAPFPAWPVIDEEDEKALLEVMRGRKWSRSYGGQTTGRFEEAYANATGARHCIAVANGTSALHASLSALGVGPGDEVILPPYTFVATLNVILLQYALPVFADIDPATFQLDARKMEAAVTDRTTAVVPVHLGGNVADLDAILAAAKPRKLPVVEDACQAHLAEWRGRKAGTWGDTGCFSFQASKNWNCGEGGAVLCNDAALAEKIFAFHNNCRPRNVSGLNFNYLGSRGANLRLTEFQAAVLLSQMRRVDEQARRRSDNALYLSSMLKEIPGIQPAAMYEGCTRNAWHLFMFRYDATRFAGLSRAKFMSALGAEGIPCSAGYSPLNKDPLIQTALQSRAYQRIFPPEVLKNWAERTQCPQNDRLCQEAVWFVQTMMLGARTDMEQIAAAIRKIQTHAADLAKA